MKKFEILKAVVDFAESCEANGVEAFVRYAPHVNMASIDIYSGGKWSPDGGGIEFTSSIYFDEPEPFEQLKKIIEQVIDKYYH